MSFSMSPFPLRFGSRQGGGGFSPDFWLDSNAESDGDGSQASPFNLLASAISAVNSHGNGAKLAVVTDSHFRGALSYTGSLTGVETRAVGEGARPIFDGSRIISAGAITAHASYANVYQVNVTVETETAPTGGANGSNTFHIALYEDETLLTEQFASGTIDTNVQSVRDTPGSYTAHKVGSTTADPRTDTGGTQYTYYFHLTDSGDPRSNGAVMAYAEQAQVGLFGNGSVWQGLEFRRSATKDMTGMADSSSVGGGSITNCVFRDPGCHGGVLRPAVFAGNFCYGRQDGRSKLVGGGGINFFYGQADDSVSVAITCRDNYVENFTTGYYSHGLNSNAVHDSFNASDNEAVDCSTAMSIAPTENGLVSNGLVATNCAIAIASPTSGSAVFRRVSHLSPETGDATAIVLYGDATVEDSSFVLRTNGTAMKFSNELAQGLNSEDVIDLALTNVSFDGGKRPNTARRRQVNLTATDSVVGDLATANGAETLTSIVAVNSYISEEQKTVAEMVTDGATLTDCLSPWQIEDIAQVAGSDDVTAVVSGRGASEDDSPSDVISVNYSDIQAGWAIRVVDVDGAGGTFETFGKTQIDVAQSPGDLEIWHDTTMNFTSKGLSYIHYNKTFDFEAPLRQYTGTRTTDGPSWEVDFATSTISGQQGSTLWLMGNTPFRLADGGTPNSSTDPQIDAANGVVDVGFYCRVGDTVTVTACVNRLDDDVIWAGDPESTGVAILDPSSPLYALGMGRQTA